MTAPNTTSPGQSPGYVAVAPDSSGKKVANFAVKMYVDNQDGLGPTLQTVFLQAVSAYALDDNGNPLGRDDVVDYEWKRQMLDETRATRLGVELLLETGRPTYDPSKSLIEEARAMRTDDGTERIEQEV